MKNVFCTLGHFTCFCHLFHGLWSRDLHSKRPSSASPRWEVQVSQTVRVRIPVNDARKQGQRNSTGEATDQYAYVGTWLLHVLLRLLGDEGLNLAFGLATSCCGWKTACCWLRCGSSSIGDLRKGGMQYKLMMPKGPWTAQ